ncbi:phosphatidylinositol-specific phospholipase C/glycerophosphodiester phosphodiesterase family protein [Parabacteroides gordonii]|uniref:phosphatidylinositol-specific phospholipase C/glycerophosphodiester phosphodiesterase family protein n=1 Tax=Parabacteroides gordonii TaxID=574930 RepID=UPI00325B9E6B
MPRQADTRIHYNAFSHNDYWRENPLLDALSFRFNCVEADLWLIDGELYVSHDRPQPDPSITFANLYLKPLAERIRANGGKVYSGSDCPFYLMVDCKEKGEAMYKVLKEQMESYKDFFCSVDNETYKEGPVLLFLSGDRPKESLPKEAGRFTFLDGQIKDLGKGIPASLAPVVSDNYADLFTWDGTGEMPADQLQKMREIIGEVHKEGKLFRWWGAPDTEIFKKFFIREGVDLIGADDLNGLYNVLIK